MLFFSSSVSEGDLLSLNATFKLRKLISTDPDLIRPPEKMGHEAERELGGGLGRAEN